MEDLRRSIGLRGYGQKDPLNEYKGEAFKYFESLMSKIRNDVCLGLFRSASSLEVLQAMIEKMQRKFGDRAEAAASGGAGGSARRAAQIRRRRTQEGDKAARHRAQNRASQNRQKRHGRDSQKRRRGRNEIQKGRTPNPQRRLAAG